MNLLLLRHAACLVFVCLCWLGACDETFVFDPIAPKVSVVQGCTPSSCPFRQESCSATACSLECESAKCLGTCADRCEGHCERSSKCALTAGQQASLLCEEAATCEFKAANNAKIDCTGTSECDVICEGICSLTCGTQATCHLTCAGDKASVQVQGSKTCAGS